MHTHTRCASRQFPTMIKLTQPSTGYPLRRAPRQLDFPAYCLPSARTPRSRPLSDSSWLSDLSCLECLRNVSKLRVCVLTTFTAYKRNARSIFSRIYTSALGPLVVYSVYSVCECVYLSRYHCVCVWRAEQGQGVVSGQKPRAHLWPIAERPRQSVSSICTWRRITSSAPPPPPPPPTAVTNWPPANGLKEIFNIILRIRIISTTKSLNSSHSGNY